SECTSCERSLNYATKMARMLQSSTWTCVALIRHAPAPDNSNNPAEYDHKGQQMIASMDHLTRYTHKDMTFWKESSQVMSRGRKR
ncbi:hypothetical protein L9F63_011586, partial [Diploptera punctata]